MYISEGTQVKLAVDYNKEVDTSEYDVGQLTIHPDNQSIYLGREKVVQGVTAPVYIPYTNKNKRYVGIGTKTSPEDLIDSVSIGYESQALDERSVAIGAYSKAMEIGCTAIGDTASASKFSVSLGHTTSAKETSTAVGLYVNSANSSVCAGYSVSGYQHNIAIGTDISISNDVNNYGRICIGHELYPNSNNFQIVMGTKSRRTSIPGQRMMVLSNGSAIDHNQVEISDTTIRLIDSDDNIYDIRDEIEKAYATWEVID